MVEAEQDQGEDHECKAKRSDTGPERDHTVEVDIETLVYLDDHGFRPGACAEVKDRAPDGTLTLAVNGVAMAVTPVLGAQLYVSGPSEPSATRATAPLPPDKKARVRGR